MKRKTPPLTTSDHAPLKKDRIKFGVASLLYNGDEQAFAPLHTAVIRELGGGDIHLGFIGALPSVLQLFGWIGTLILKATRHHRRGLIIALIASSSLQALIVTSLLLANVTPALMGLWLTSYTALVVFMAMITGAQQNIAVSWIGELVPTRQRGWFVSGMAIISSIGLVLLQAIFARLARNAGLPGYAVIVGLLCLNTVVAIFLVASTTNRPAKAVNFLSQRHGERVNYRFLPLWLMIWFDSAWRCGRVALVAFSTAYLIDHFGYRMERIILIFMLMSIVNVVTLFITGKISDRIGNFLPLLIITALCATSMLLWVSSAWLGILPIIAYQLINGAAGPTHWMLVSNLSLEIYPSMGRPNYLAFSRIIAGLFVIITSTYAGHLLSGLRGWSIVLWGSEFNHYHLFFLCCTLVTLTSVIPLLILRWIKPEINEDECPAE